jgi:hypothetical protein
VIIANLQLCFRPFFPRDIDRFYRFLAEEIASKVDGMT